MKAVIVEKDGSLSLKEVPTPKCKPKEALVKMVACGMCGTDIHIIRRRFKGFPQSSYPLILGHEGVGEVIEIGADVKTYKIGDKVLLPFNDATPEIGVAYGALAEYGVIQDGAAYPKGEAPEVSLAQNILPNDIDPVDAIMFVTYTEVLSTIKYFGVKPEDSIVVFGCGPVGQTYIKLLSLLGNKNIIAVDIMDEKLEIAKKFGATVAFNGKKVDLAKEVRALYPDGVCHVLDAVGLPEVATLAMPLLADRGNVLCYGVLESEEITINFSKASYNWNFICQQMPRKKEEGEAFPQILEWIRSGALDMNDFISDYFEFDDSVEAYGKYLDRKVIKKGIIRF